MKEDGIIARAAPGASEGASDPKWFRAAAMTEEFQRAVEQACVQHLRAGRSVYWTIGGVLVETRPVPANEERGVAAETVGRLWGDAALLAAYQRVVERLPRLIGGALKQCLHNGGYITLQQVKMVTERIIGHIRRGGMEEGVDLKMPERDVDAGHRQAWRTRHDWERELEWALTLMDERMRAIAANRPCGAETKEEHERLDSVLTRLRVKAVRVHGDATA